MERARSSPRAEYERRLGERRRKASEKARRHLLLSNSRLAVFLAAAVMTWLAFESRLFSPLWLLAPGALFLLLVVIHSRVLREKGTAERAVRFYEAAVDRLNHRWVGKGEAGERFRDPSHAYADDLDLFGRGSLYELLCTTRTAAGAETLARWLKAPAEPATVRARQEAVEELRLGLDLREGLAVLGEEVQPEIEPDLLTRWGLAPPVMAGGFLRGLCVLSTLVVLAAVAAALWSWIGVRFLAAVLFLQAVLATLLRPRVLKVTEALEKPGRELALFAKVLARLETERFRSDLLKQLRAALDAEGAPPSAQVARLSRFIEFLDWRRNLFFGPVAALLLWRTHLAFAIDRWRARIGPAIPRWLEVVGEMEALCALAAYAYEHPEDPFPDVEDAGTRFDGDGLGHPLIPDERCVRNDVCLDDALRLLVVSGSNMSGKTTLLRTVGTNTVLALAGGPVRARRLRLSPLQVGACIRVEDSIQEGRSRFYAEILRLRQIVDLTEEDSAVLFLLDEILHGTNSHDRSIGAQGVVAGLVGRGGVGLVTTHDLALAKIADDLGGRAANVHFEDHLEAGRMVFDYRMRPGVVRKSNALELMRTVGLKV